VISSRLAGCEGILARALAPPTGTYCASNFVQNWKRNAGVDSRRGRAFVATAAAVVIGFGDALPWRYGLAVAIRLSSPQAFSVAENNSTMLAAAIVLRIS
jgi:hypothetical protein